MKDIESNAPSSTIGRRDFLKLGAGGGALAMAALNVPAAAAPSSAVRPGSVDLAGGPDAK